MDRKSLKAMYAELNTSTFEGKLPAIKVSARKTASKGFILFNLNKEGKQVEIHVSSSMDDATQKETLLIAMKSLKEALNL